MTPSTFSIVTGGNVRDLVERDIAGCIEVIEHAYRAHDEGNATSPTTSFLRPPERPEDRLASLPAFLDSPWNVCGVKWIASVPRNVQRGFPRASAVVILNDAITGYPFACIEGSIVSAARTAASAALAARCLRDPRRAYPRLGIIGTGVIARWTYRFLTGSGWDFRQIYLHDLDRSRAERFREQVIRTGDHESVRVVEQASEALGCADIVVLTTTASRPHIHEGAWLQMRPLVLHLSLRDLAPGLIERSCNIVDDLDHVMQADTSVHLAERALGSRDFVCGTLSEVLGGSVAPDHERPVVFSPFGLGTLDIALGQWVYRAAVASGRYRAIEEFFCKSEL